jgi:hypothetical protein
MEGGVARAEATGGAAVPVLDPALEARGRLVRHAVATVLDALGEHVSVYQAHAQKWGEVAADPATAKLPVLPQAIRHAGQKLPATPPHLIPAHKAFVKTVDRLRKQFRGDAPKPAARRALTKRDSLSAAVRGCFRVLPSVRCLRLLTMLPTLVLPLFFGRVQSFAEPVPGWPVGQEALLTALAEWVRAEAADVRIATPRADGAAAKRYVAMLLRSRIVRPGSASTPVQTTVWAGKCRRRQATTRLRARLVAARRLSGPWSSCMCGFQTLK